MPNDLRTIELLIKAANDQQASQQTIAQLTILEARIRALGETTLATDRQIVGLGASMGDIRENPEILRIANDLKRTTEAAREASTELDKLSGQGGGGSKGRFGGAAGPGGLGFSEFLGGMALRTAPQGPVGDVLTRSLLGAGSVNSIISQIQQMSTAMGGLGPALGSVLAGLGPVTAAFLVINAALAIWTHAQEDAKKSVEAQTEALRLFYKTIEEGTTATIEKAIVVNEQEQRASKGVIAGLDQQLEAKKTEVDPNKNTLQLKAEYDALQGQRDKEQQTLNKLTEAHKGLTDALSSEEVAARDAAIARVKAAEDAVDEAVREGKQKRTGSSKGLGEEMAELTDQMNADAEQIAKINDLIKNGIATPEDIAEKKRLLEELNTAAKQFDADKVLLPVVQAREREKQEIDDLLKAQDKRNAELQKEMDAIARINEQMAALQAARDKQVRREDEETAIQATRTGITKDWQRRIQDAKDQEAEEDHQREIAKMKDAERLQERRLTESHDRQIDKINGEYMDSELKRFQAFRDQEADDLAKFNRKYARALEDIQDRLTDAASRRDVAGFIQAQRDGEKQLRRLSEDFADQDKDRVKHYLKEQAAARDNRQKQLAEAERAYREQLQLMRDQLAERLEQDRQAHERRIRQSEVLERQFQQMRESWQIEDNMRRRRIEQEDFDERMAILRGQLAQQRALIQANMQATINAPGQATTPTAQLAAGISSLGSLGGNAVSFVQNLLGGFGGTPSGGAPGFTTGTPLPTTRQNRNLLPDRFAGGKDFVPHDFFPAYLDYGERVLNRHENAAYSSGRSGGTTVNVYNTVGDIATKSMLDSYQVETVRSIRKVIDR